MGGQCCHNSKDQGDEWEMKQVDVPTRTNIKGYGGDAQSSPGYSYSSPNRSGQREVKSGWDDGFGDMGGWGKSGGGSWTTTRTVNGKTVTEHGSWGNGGGNDQFFNADDGFGNDNVWGNSKGFGGAGFNDFEDDFNKRAQEMRNRMNNQMNDWRNQNSQQQSQWDNFGGFGSSDNNNFGGWGQQGGQPTPSQPRNNTPSQPRNNIPSNDNHPSVKPTAPAQAASSDKGAVIQRFLQYLNDVRANPSKYAQRVKQLYVDTAVNYQGRAMKPGINLVYNEGYPAFEEAIRFLSSAQPKRPMTLDAGLCAAANDQSKHNASRGQPSHTGPDGSSCQQRMLRYGKFGGYSSSSAENCGQHMDTNEETWILDFVIDDGVPQRGHRENIFTNDSKVGLAYNKGNDGRWYTTMVFSGDSYHSNAIPAQTLQTLGLS